MENASKALLIAASLLIIILLISFGIKIFNSSKESSKDAQAVGESIVSSATTAKINAILSMINYKDEAAFKEFINNNYGNGRALSKNEVIELYEFIMKRTQIIYNENYKWDTIHPPSRQGRGAIYYSSGTMDYETLKNNKKYKLKFDSNSNPASIVVLVEEIN